MTLQCDSRAFILHDTPLTWQHVNSTSDAATISRYSYSGVTSCAPIGPPAGGSPRFSSSCLGLLRPASGWKWARLLVGLASPTGTPGYPGGAVMSKAPGYERYGGAPSAGIGIAPGGTQLRSVADGLVIGIGGGEVLSGSSTGVRTRLGGAVAIAGGGTEVLMGEAWAVHCAGCWAATGPVRKCASSLNVSNTASPPPPFPLLGLGCGRGPLGGGLLPRESIE